MAKKTKTATLTRSATKNTQGAPAKVPRKLVADLRKMIDESRHVVSETVNAALVVLYWNIGKRIREDILKQKRAEYGEQIVYAVSSWTAPLRGCFLW